MSIATCIGCGCDDNHACRPGGCFWVRVDYKAGVGVCSQCEEFTAAWDAGVRVRRYRPSNGTIAHNFLCDWCGTCNRATETPCIIAARSMIYQVHDPAYPVEWQVNRRGEPVCTAHARGGTHDNRC